MGKEYGSQRYLEIDTGSGTYAKLISVDTAKRTSVGNEETTNVNSDGDEESVPTIKRVEVDASGVYEDDDSALAALLDAMDEKSPGDEGYCTVPARYVTPTYTYAGSLVWESIDEDAPAGGVVRYTLNGAKFSGAVTRSAS